MRVTFSRIDSVISYNNYNWFIRAAGRYKGGGLFMYKLLREGWGVADNGMMVIKFRWWGLFE
jgi:hypothetical protein